MSELLTFAREFGWLALMLVWMLANAGKMADWFERQLGRIWPAMAERRAAHLQYEQERAQARLGRETRAFQDLIAVYQHELADQKNERKRAQGQVYQLLQRHEQQMSELVQRYEQYNAQSVEVLQAIEMTIREQGQRLEQIEHTLSR